MNSNSNSVTPESNPLIREILKCGSVEIEVTGNEVSLSLSAESEKDMPQPDLLVFNREAWEQVRGFVEQRFNHDAIRKDRRAKRERQ